MLVVDDALQPVRPQPEVQRAESQGEVTVQGDTLDHQTWAPTFLGRQDPHGELPPVPPVHDELPPVTPWSDLPLLPSLPETYGVGLRPLLGPSSGLGRGRSPKSVPGWGIRECSGLRSFPCVPLRPTILPTGRVPNDP